MTGALAGLSLVACLAYSRLGATELPNNRLVICSLLGSSSVRDTRVTGCMHAEETRDSRRTLYLVRRAVKRSAKALEARPSPALILERALLEIVMPQGKRDLIEQAAGYLKLQARSKPEAAAFLNDLAVVHIFLGRQKPRHLIQALSLLDEASDLDRSLAEAHFNRTLVLQRLSLAGASERAWREYLTQQKRPYSRPGIDEFFQANPPTHWLESRFRSALAEAASGHQSTRVRQLVHSNPQWARLFVEDEVLPAWAAAEGRSARGEADRFAGVARQVGQELWTFNGDLLLRDAVKIIDAGAGASTPTVQQLVDGYRNLATGLAHYKEGKPSLALSFFERARIELQAAGSPSALWAGYYEAVALYLSGNVERALSSFVLLERSVIGKSYLSFRGRLNWSIGLIEGVLGRFGPSHERYITARSGFVALGETEHSHVLDFLLSESFEDLGQVNEAWLSRFRALQGLSVIASRQWRHNILFSLAEVCAREGEQRAALYFQDEVVHNAEKSRNPVWIFESLLARSRTHEALGRMTRAKADAELAKLAAGAIEDHNLALRAVADAQLRLGELHFYSQPREALALFRASLSIYRRLDYLPQVIRLRLLIARCYSQLGRRVEAAGELEAALSDVSVRQASVHRPGLRVSLHEALRAVYDEIESFHFTSGDLEEAFAASEVRRSNLLPGLPGGATPGHDIAWLQEILPPESALIKFDVLPQVTLVWFISSEQVWAKAVPLGREQIKIRVNRLHSRLKGQTAAAQEELGSLYDELIVPVGNRLREGTELVIIPDRELWEVPFGALYDRRRRSYLVERHELAVLPSAAALGRFVTQPQCPRTPMPAVLFTSPALNRRMFVQLPPLDAAVREARSAKQVYATARIFEGSAATVGELLVAIQQRSLIQVSAHSVVNARDPLQSLLVMSPSPQVGEDGLLTTEELLSARTHRCATVLLLTCSSGRGATQASELSLAQAFLLSGAQNVVGTLWDIRDGDLGPILARVHSSISRGATPRKALRLAQIAAIRGGIAGCRDPSNWAALQVWGLDYQDFS